jgi:hypothetical protein
MVFAALFVAAFVPASQRRACAQTQTGSVSFTAQITPSAGLAEPVRGLPVYLLRKSFTAIQEEAAASVPKPEMDKFIDSQKLSKELIAWMHKHHTVYITGEEFASNLTPQEIIYIPEFWQAFFEINAGSKAWGFPMPKYDDREKARNPEKYQHDVDEYHAKVTKYIVENPDSKDEMDEYLATIDPGPHWDDRVAARESQVHRMALDWAQSRYMVAQTQTDLNGRAGFGSVPAGSYWLSSLNVEGRAGDMDEKWDVPVAVRAGSASQIILSNYNAVVAKSAS